VTGAVEVVLAVLSWLGACLIVLADGRRAVASGLLIAGLALSAIRALDGPLLPALLLAAGTVACAGGRLVVGGRPGWLLLPAGSTPRVIACVAFGAVALWLALNGLSDPGEWQTRASIAVVIALGGARLLTSEERGPSLSAAAMLALGTGALAAAITPQAAAVVAGFASAVALVLTLMPVRMTPDV
jgi:hypothetical protein